MVKKGKAITLLDEKYVMDNNIRCSKTGKKASIKYYNFYYTRGVYLNLVRDRIKKQLLGKLNTNYKIVVFGELSRYYIRKLYPSFNFDFISDSDIMKYLGEDKNTLSIASTLLGKYDLIIFPWTLDDEINLFWKKLSLSELSNIQFTKSKSYRCTTHPCTSPREFYNLRYNTK